MFCSCAKFTNNDHQDYQGTKKYLGTAAVLVATTLPAFLSYARDISLLQPGKSRRRFLTETSLPSPSLFSTSPPFLFLALQVQSMCSCRTWNARGQHFRLWWEESTSTAAAAAATVPTPKIAHDDEEKRSYGLLHSTVQ